MKVELEGRASYRRLFGVQGFPQIATGTVLARTAVQLWQIALVLFVLERFRSPVLAGIASFLSIAPGLAVSPIAGALLDRQGRLRMILLDYGVAASSLILLAVLSMVHQLTPATLLPVVAVSSLTGPLSASGIRSLFPLVVPRDLWDRANGVDSGSMALATVVGPALAGFLIAWVSGEGAFLVTAGLYGLSALTLIGVRDPQKTHAASGPLLRVAWQALVFVLRHATLRGVMLTLFTGNVGFGILAVAMPVLVFTRFHWGADAVGELWSVAGVATVAAGLLIGRINTEGRERRMVAAGMGLGAAGTALLIVAGGTPLLVVAMLLLGLSAGPIDIGLFALRQRRTDPAWFGRAFAVSMSLNFAGAPVGSALAGPIVTYSVTLAIGLSAAISVLACFVPFLTIPREG
jgi:MFS family permease